MFSLELKLFFIVHCIVITVLKLSLYKVANCNLMFREKTLVSTSEFSSLISQKHILLSLCTAILTFKFLSLANATVTVIPIDLCVAIVVIFH